MNGFVYDASTGVPVPATFVIAPVVEFSAYDCWPLGAPVVIDWHVEGAPLVPRVGVQVILPNVFADCKLKSTLVLSTIAVLQAVIRDLPCAFAAEISALSFCARKPGTATAESTPRITTVIRSSISVKPFSRRFCPFLRLRMES